MKIEDGLGEKEEEDIGNDAEEVENGWKADKSSSGSIAGGVCK